jgi:hypothetical protein
MKKFSFPLDRVLSWRQTQARLEEANLARLASELQALNQRHSVIQQSLVTARTSLLSAPSATPIEIGAMEHHRASASAQTRFLLQSRHTLQQKISQQTQTVMERRRDAQLLERLRAQRFKTWQTGVAREVDQQAEESFMSRFTAAARLQ